jgi:colanic acid biosynthesis glycosyl transferase WcaI
MRQRILEKLVPTDKVRLIPNFVEIDDMAPLPKANGFSRQHGLDGEFVVTYAGNMGPAQGLETVLEAASLLRHESGLRFLLVGERVLHNRLKALVRASRSGKRPDPAAPALRPGSRCAVRLRAQRWAWPEGRT